MLNINERELVYRWDEIERNFSRFLEYKMAHMQKPLICFGAGWNGRCVRNDLLKLGIFLSCYIDNDCNKQGKILDGLQVYSYEKMKIIYKEYDILLVDIYAREKRNQLFEANEKNNIFFLNEMYLSLDIARYTYDYFKKNECKFQESYNLLVDDESKQLFEASIKRNITGNLDYFKNITIYLRHQYFVRGIMDCTQNEVYVDVGAYQGDSINDFLCFCNENYKKVIAVEADRFNYYRLVEFTNQRQIANIQTHNVALYSDNRVITFNESRSIGSMIVENHQVSEHIREISTVALDDLLKGDQITFLKIDVEGAELAVLEGGKQTIINWNPKIAVCVYHKAEDMITIPQYLSSLVPEYKFYLRQHSPSSSDTVLYAVL